MTIEPISDVRPPRPDELALAATLLNIDTDLFDKGLQVVVLDAGPDSGVAAYSIPNDVAQATQLGGIVLPPIADIKDMYRLILGVAKAGLAAGCKTGESHGVSAAALVRALSRTFKVTLIEEGWEPRTEDQVRKGEPAVPMVWGFYVDLEDVVAQLEQAIG